MQRARQARGTKRSLRRDNPFCPECLKPTLDSVAVCGGCNKDRPAGGWPSDNYTGRTIIDKYWVLDRIGASEDSILLRAYQVQAGFDLGDVVLRILQPLFAANRAYCQRFADEAKAARRLRSPHLTKVFDFDFDELGIPFVVMEKPKGPTLREVIDRSVVSAPRTIQIALQLTEALKDRRRVGLPFRNLRARDITLCHPDGFVKLSQAAIADYPSSQRLCREALDERADFFFLGVIIFECLSRQSPLLFDPPLKLRQLAPQLPEALEQLVDQMLSKDFSKRPRSFREVQTRLRAIASSNTRGVVPDHQSSW